MIGSRSTSTKESKRLTTAGLIAVTAATLLMMGWAIFPTAAIASGTLPWTGHGDENLPCPNGAHWVFTPGGKDSVTAATLTVNGVNYTMQQSGNGSWSADSTTPLTGAVTASVAYVGNLGTGNPGLQLSHCLEGPSTTTTVPTTTTTTTKTTTTSTKTTTTYPTTTSTKTKTTTTVPTTTTTYPTTTSTKTTTTVPTTTTTVPTTTSTKTTTTVPTTTTTVPTTTSTKTTTTVPTTSTTTKSPTVGPTTVEPSTGPTVAPTTVSPGGTAFTGVENVVPIGAIALMLMTSGSGLLWAGSRRKRDQNQDEE
jgi:hypothetical protein